MLIKLLIIALLLFIIFNLFRALYLMLRNDPEKVSMSKFLGRRVFFSVLVLLLVIVAMLTGLIAPHSRPY
jgi:hypothetical protein